MGCYAAAQQGVTPPTLCADRKRSVLKKPLFFKGFFLSSYLGFCRGCLTELSWINVAHAKAHPTLAINLKHFYSHVVPFGKLVANLFNALI